MSEPPYVNVRFMLMMAGATPGGGGVHRANHDRQKSVEVCTLPQPEVCPNAAAWLGSFAKPGDG